MKKFKKLTALLTGALLTVTSLGITAFAAEAPAEGNLIIHKYLMADVSQATEPGTGNEMEVPDGATPLDGITFDVYKVTIPDSGENAGKVPDNDDIVLDSYTNPTKITSGGVEFALTGKQSQTTAGGGTATFSNLTLGYYLVVEHADSRVASPAAPTVVAVPMSDADGTGWITDVHMYPKNEGVSVTKAPNVTSAFIGETVTWTVTASVPTGIEEAKKYAVVDTFDDALTFVTGSVKVEGLTQTGAASGTAIAESGNWTAAESGGTLTVNFTNLAALSSYKQVKITFDTTVAEGIMENADYTVENTAKLQFTNQFDEEKEFDTNKTTVHTGVIKIIKTDANSGSPLAGAEFQIATSAENAKVGNFLKKTADGKIVDFGQDGYNEANAWVETTAVSGDAATAVFEGLKDYTDGDPNTYKSYWIVETKAPEGYNLLSAPVKVDFTEELSTADTDYTVEVQIKNTTGFTLPKTGDIGTILFTVAGVGLIGAAVILLIASRKRKEETE